MLFPFYANPNSLKSASYEVRPSRKFVRWNEDGKRIEFDISEDGSFELPPNTISFIQLNLKFDFQITLLSGSICVYHACASRASARNRAADRSRIFRYTLNSSAQSHLKILPDTG